MSTFLIGNLEADKRKVLLSEIAVGAVAAMLSMFLSLESKELVFPPSDRLRGKIVRQLIKKTFQCKKTLLGNN